MSIPTDSGSTTAETTADSPAAAAATAELVALLGERFVTDAAAVDQSRQDRSGWPALGSPLGIAEPETVEEVQGALRIAHRHGIPVVPRGAGTGLTGGAAGTDGAIVLSTMRMAAILEISPADELAVVQPGILNGDLNDALVEYGLRFSPDPASFAISSIGGNVATNAGGLRCAKYGVTRDKVLALDVVLADGSLLTVGHRSVKGVTGYDLTALFVGSEGTLGVIVSVTVRLDPIPAAGGAIIGAFFDGVRSAAAASAAVTAAKLRPVTMELMDRASLSAIDAWTGSSFLDEGSAYLLIQTDGSGALAEAEQALEIVVAAGGRATLSVDPVVAENLLAIRRKALPALESVGRVLIEDVSVPRSAMAAMFEAIDDISARYGITIATLAHAGDGNLHPNILLDRDVTEVPEHVWQAASEIFGTALTLGGTLTGEHGIGVLKKRWLGEELGELSFSMQQQIKAVFDPTGILNPGKVF